MTATPTTLATPTPATSQWQPLPWQQMALSVPDAYDLLLSGGRGGGKSELIVQLILRDALRFGAGYVGALVRRDLSGLRKLEQQLLAQIDNIPELTGSKYISSQKELRFTTGGVLYLHYVKDEHAFSRFQGIDLSHVYVDESGQIAEPAPILRLRSSMRSTCPGVIPRMVLSCNPNNAGSWWHYDHIIRKSVPWRPHFIELFRKEVVLIHSTLFDNPHITDRDAYIEALKASCNFDEAKIQSEVYGSWGSVSGAFFGHVWNNSRIQVPSISGLPVKDSVFDEFNVWMALDWGTRAPSSLLLAYRMPHAGYWGGKYIGAGSVVLVDEVYTCSSTPDGTRQWNEGDRTLTTTRMAELARQLCRRNGIEITAVARRHRVMDAALGAEMGHKDGSIGHQLTQAGAGFISAPKGRRAPGWQLIARMLEAAGDPSVPGLYATPAVESFWGTLPTLTTSQRDPEDLDTDGPDHCADALRYLLMAMQEQRYSLRTGSADGRQGRPYFTVY
jgi:hypothetical protein